MSNSVAARTLEALRQLDGVEEQIPVDTSENETAYLVSNGSKHLRLSPTAHFLLRHYIRSTPTQDVAAEMSKMSDAEVTREDVVRAQSSVVHRVAEMTETSPAMAPGFLFHVVLLSEECVQWVSTHLMRFFRPRAVLVLLSLVAVAVLYGFTLPFNMEFGATDFVVGYALFSIALFLHEFGHSSACAYYGARPSEVGFTLYLIYPALYSNVSNAWQLKRYERVVVDVGGLYFQSVAAAGFIVLYGMTGWGAAEVAILLCVGSMVFSLNPILRMDGYWMLADALGVTNLGEQTQRIARHYYRSWMGKPTEPLPWPTWITRLLLPYSILSMLVWGLFLLFIFPMLMQYASHLPGAFMQIANVIASPRLLIDSSALTELVTALYFCFVFAILAYRLVWQRFVWAASKLWTWARALPIFQ